MGPSRPTPARIAIVSVAADHNLPSIGRIRFVLACVAGLLILLLGRVAYLQTKFAAQHQDRVAQ